MLENKEVPFATIRRVSVKILVDTGISRSDLEATMVGAAFSLIELDPDLDEMLLFAYDRRGDATGSYTFGKLEWAPGGRWGSTDGDTAQSNDRSTHSTQIDIKTRVGLVIPAENRPTEADFTFYDAVNRKIETDDRVLESDDMQKTAYDLAASELNVSVEQVSAAWVKVDAFNNQ